MQAVVIKSASSHKAVARGRSHSFSYSIQQENTLGRFLQPDPIGFEAGDVNWYRYVGNSVVNYRDPEGWAAWAYIVATLSAALHAVANHLANKMPDCAQKCKEECLKCCDSLGSWAHTAKAVAYLTGKTGCVALVNPFWILACMGALDAEYATGGQGINAAIMNCKSNCK